MKVRRFLLLRPQRGFTLAEVLITSAIVSVAGLAIIAAIVDGVYFQQSIRERNGALRVAADQLESAKRELFGSLQSRTEPVTIDDRGTAQAADNVNATATLRFFLPNGNEVGVSGAPLPDDGSMVIVESRVEWNPAGRQSSRTQTVVLTTTLSP